MQGVTCIGYWMPMKFGETFFEYLHGDCERFLSKCSHVEYKRLKKVLKRCKLCREVQRTNNDESLEGNSETSVLCLYCDKTFFSELSKEASEISGHFRSRVRQLLHLHYSYGLRSYIWCACHFFMYNRKTMIHDGKILIDYVTANATAIRKILKKYDKIHSSVNGRNFNIKMRAEHIELLHSPWLIELGAFYMNYRGSEIGQPGEFFKQFSCNFSDGQFAMVLTLSDSNKFEYSLTCAVCLDIVFHPYALHCGHLFCKSCACSAASLLLFEDLKSASPNAKCPVCRETGVYSNAVHMSELATFLKNRCPEYYKERKMAEREHVLKQTKEFWQSQARFAIGY